MIGLKTLKVTALAAVMGLGLTVGASAAIIELSPGDETYSGTSGPGLPAVEADVLATHGIDLAATELYRSNVGGADEKPFAGAYDTEYFNTPGDPEDATISWNGGDTYIDDPSWLLVKDGKNDPVWYLFDISGWDGKMDIVLTDFWPGSGAISHVSIYGGGECCGDVPEPGPIGLLGFGMVALYIIRRRRLAS